MQEFISDRQSYMDAIAKDTTLYDEMNFEDRSEAIEAIAECLSDPMMNAIQQQALQLSIVLEEVNSQLYQKLKSMIRGGACRGPAFKALVDTYVPCSSATSSVVPGYDNLDLFINGLSLFPAMPEQTRELEPEMVYYQKTPARIVFELVEQWAFKSSDVFVDIGAGLGQVAILVHLLTGIRTCGIELEPAFCEAAASCAAELGLSDVSFINTDARQADYTTGTVFFMFTPFTGEMMQEVLALLQKVSRQRKISIITYGPCTAQLAQQSWLSTPTLSDSRHCYKPVFFSSF